MFFDFFVWICEIACLHKASQTCVETAEGFSILWLGCRKLHTSYFTLTCGEKCAVSFLRWRPFCSLCLHQRLEACRRSRRPLYRRSAAKGLLFAFHWKFSSQWLISRIFQAISSISGLHFHRGELQTLGSVVEKSLLFLRKKCFGKKSEIWNPFKSFWSALCVFYAWSSSPDVVDKHNHI